MGLSSMLEGKISFPHHEGNKEADSLDRRWLSVFCVSGTRLRVEPMQRMDVFYSKCMHVEMNALCPPCLGTSS